MARNRKPLTEAQREARRLRAREWRKTPAGKAAMKRDAQRYIQKRRESAERREAGMRDTYRRRKEARKKRNFELFGISEDIARITTRNEASIVRIVGEVLRAENAKKLEQYLIDNNLTI